jgi:hypothetical protein
MARMRIGGFRDASIIEDIFASSMVDVAYVDEVTPDAIYVIGDVWIDFDRPEDFAWVKDVIETTLEEYGVRELEITVTNGDE